MDQIKLGEIPQIDGISIDSIEKTGDETYTITKSDESTFEFTIPNGITINNIIKADNIPNPSDAVPGVLYLVATERNPPDVYDEYYLINERMELLGVTTPVLDNLYTKTEADEQLELQFAAAQGLDLEYDGGVLNLYGQNIVDGE